MTHCCVCRSPIPYRDVEERSKDWGEVLAKLPTEEHADLLSTQSARCMNCGTPFCHQTDSGTITAIDMLFEHLTYLHL